MRAACRSGRATSSSASRASATAGYSDAGSAWAMRAADRAPVADLEVADQRRRLGEQRHGVRRPSASCSTSAWRVHGAAPCRVPFVPLDAPQLVDPVDVDEVLEPGEAQRQHRHEALTAGEHLGVVAVARRAAPTTSPSDSGAWYSNGAGFIGGSRHGWAA